MTRAHYHGFIAGLIFAALVLTGLTWMTEVR